MAITGRLSLTALQGAVDLGLDVTAAALQDLTAGGIAVLPGNGVYLANFSAYKDYHVGLIVYNADDINLNVFTVPAPRWNSTTGLSGSALTALHIGSAGDRSIYDYDAYMAATNLAGMQANANYVTVPTLHTSIIWFDSSNCIQADGSLAIDFESADGAIAGAVGFIIAPNGTFPGA